MDKKKHWKSLIQWTVAQKHILTYPFFNHVINIDDQKITPTYKKYGSMFERDLSWWF